MCFLRLQWPVINWTILPMSFLDPSLRNRLNFLEFVMFLYHNFVCLHVFKFDHLLFQFSSVFLSIFWSIYACGTGKKGSGPDLSSFVPCFANWSAASLPSWPTWALIHCSVTEFFSPRRFEFWALVFSLYRWEKT